VFFCLSCICAEANAQANWTFGVAWPQTDTADIPFSGTGPNFAPYYVELQVRTGHRAGGGARVQIRYEESHSGTVNGGGTYANDWKLVEAQRAKWTHTVPGPISKDGHYGFNMTMPAGSANLIGPKNF